MKKVKKILIVLMIVFICPTLLVGCKPKVGLDESAKIWFNFTVKGDKVSLSTFGITENEVNKLSKIQTDTYKKQLKSGFISNDLKIEDKQVEQIFQAYMEAINKVTITTSIVSQNDESAEVKIKSTYINLATLYEKSATDAANKFKDSNITSQQEFKNKISETFINNLIKEFKNATPSVSTKEKTFNFVIKDKIWVPKNVASFGESIVKLASGQ